MTDTSDERPKAGWRYVITTSFEAGVLTHWFAPFTGGENRLLPAGLEFVVINDPPPSATGVGAKPELYEHWENLLVQEEDRKAENYGGYSLSISLAHLATHCARR